MRGEINLLWSQTRHEGNAPQDSLLVRQQDLIMRNQVRTCMKSMNLQELRKSYLINIVYNYTDVDYAIGQLP